MVEWGDCTLDNMAICMSEMDKEGRIGVTKPKGVYVKWMAWAGLRYMTMHVCKYFAIGYA